MIFKESKWYDRMKWLVTVGLPALTTLWLTIASIWSIPYAEPIGATLGAITVFLATLLGISSIKYAKSQESEKTVLLEEKNDSKCQIKSWSNNDQK